MPQHILLEVAIKCIVAIVQLLKPLFFAFKPNQHIKQDWDS